MKKPFDGAPSGSAEGLTSKNNRDNRTAIELFTASVRAMPARLSSAVKGLATPLKPLLYAAYTRLESDAEGNSTLEAARLLFMQQVAEAVQYAREDAGLFQGHQRLPRCPARRETRQGMLFREA
jgi:hypothetical protein